MINPLLEKFYELHPEKKEKPKKAEIELSKDLQKDLGASTISVANPNSLITNSSGSNYITATNANVSVKPKALQTYDVDSSKDAFLQIAEKVKQGDAKVTCVTFHSETVGMFSTGLNTVTFEVQYLDGF